MARWKRMLPARPRMACRPDSSSHRFRPKHSSSPFCRKCAFCTPSASNGTSLPPTILFHVDACTYYHAYGGGKHGHSQMYGNGAVRIAARDYIHVKMGDRVTPCVESNCRCLDRCIAPSMAIDAAATVHSA
eukprot:2780209-Prymnesium_polylepis.2